MRSPVLFACLLSATAVGQSRPPVTAPPYFPAGIFDASHQNVRDKWYSSTLHALQEPSLFALKSDPSQQVYRFLWLPSFHRPISVRLTIHADGSGSVVTRSVDSHAGLLTRPATDTEKLILDRTTALDRAKVQEVLDQLRTLDFWSVPTEPSVYEFGADGSQWVLEGVRNGEYHVVDRWSPADSPFSQLCKHLFGLGEVEATLY